MVITRVMKERHMKRTMMVVVIMVFASAPIVWSAGTDVVNALRQEAVELQTPADTQIQAVEMIDLGCGECEKWLGEKGWTDGLNKRVEGDFYVYSEWAQIDAPPGHPNYVVSRQNAYTKAFMGAKRKLLQGMASVLSREISFNKASGKFVIDQPSAAQPKPQEEEANSAAIKRKTLQLVNAFLDENLKKKGIQSKEPEAGGNSPALAKAAEEVLNSSQFNEIIKTSASSQLKGVRRIFVAESVSAGKQGQICVVALCSSKTMAMADAIFMDESLAPNGVPEKPIRAQVADWKSPEGVKKLISTFGTEMLRDEHGQFHLVAYAQSTPMSDSQTSIQNAIRMAQIQADAELRGFGQEYAAFEAATQSREKAVEMLNAINSYESSNAYQEKLQSISPPKSMSGITSVGTWAAKHPLTNQVIVGSIVRWSPGDARNARKLSNDMNSPAGGQGGSAAKANTTFGPDALKSKGSYQGSASGGSNAQDF
jgi:hypothetical protein